MVSKTIVCVCLRHPFEDFENDSRACGKNNAKQALRTANLSVKTEYQAEQLLIVDFAVTVADPRAAVGVP